MFRLPQKIWGKSKSIYRRCTIILALLLTCSIAHAEFKGEYPGYGTTTGWVVGRHLGLLGGNSMQASESAADCVSAIDMTITKLEIDLNTAPGGFTNRHFQLRVNTADSSPDMDCSINSSATECEDTSVEVDITPGDLFNVDHATILGSPAASGGAASIIYKPDNINEFLLCGTSRTEGLVSGGTRYISPAGAGGMESTEFLAEIVSPGEFTVAALYAQKSNRMMNVTVTMRKNGADTSMTCSMAGATQTCNDTTNTFTISAGDSITLKAVAGIGALGTSTIKYGLAMQSAVDGQFIFPTSTDSNPSSVSTTYGSVWSGDNPYSTSESRHRSLSEPVIKFQKMYVEFQNAPASGNDWDVTLRKNGADTNLTCQVSDSATTCNDVEEEIIEADDDLINIELVPTSSPVSGSLQVSFLAEIPPRRIW